MASWLRWPLAALLAVQTANCNNNDKEQVQSISRVFQFGNNGTIAENIAVRANGNILFTISYPSAQVWEVDPAIGNSSGHLVASNAALGSHANALGLAELKHDLFAVISGNATVANTFTISTLDFSHRGHGQAGSEKSAPRITTVASVPNAVLLNGLVALSDHEVLASDSVLGVIFRISIKTGASAIVLRDPSLEPSTDGNSFPLGVNGIRKLGAELYYTNSGQKTYSRVIINDDGTAAGPFELLADVGALQPLPDDFALKPDGTAFIAGSNELLVAQPSGEQYVLAGGVEQAVLAGVTSVQFGRRRNDRRTLYVSTSGGANLPVNGTFIEPGFISAIKLQ